MDKLMSSTSIIIPVLNESLSVCELLSSLKKQSVLPDQIIFVDAGSTDNTQAIIEKWWTHNRWDGTSLKIILSNKALPGKARNVGIMCASSEWLLFLDAGIIPDYDWLEQLRNCIDKNTEIPAAFGQCVFEPNGLISTSVTAVSYGIKKKHLALPASMFHKSIFDDVGYFREDLRAAEDHEWFSRFRERFGVLPVCQSALVHYQEVPNSYSAVFSKWRRAAYFTCRAKIRKLQTLFYMFLPVILLSAYFISSTLFVFAVISYILYRGVFSPILKGGFYWWSDNPLLLLLALPTVIVIDVAKFIGFIRGVLDFYVMEKDHLE
jgi:glycosyltransferase involved in cell wall biosynthesis